MTANGTVVPARVRYVAVDADGTLLESGGRTSLRTRRAVAQAVTAGIGVAVVTSRPDAEALAIAEAHGATGPVGASNGAVVLDARSGRVLHRRDFPAPATTVARLRRLGSRLRVGVVGTDVIGLDPGFPPALRSVWGLPPEIRAEEAVRGAAVHKFVVTGLTEAEYPSFVAAFGHDHEVSYSTSEFVELTPGGVDKGAAVRWIAQSVGVALAQWAAIGDMPNDLPMFRAVGFPMAVANAHPDVLAAASLVLPSNDESGVAVALEALMDARAGRAGRSSSSRDPA